MYVRCSSDTDFEDGEVCVKLMHSSSHTHCVSPRVQRANLFVGLVPLHQAPRPPSESFRTVVGALAHSRRSGMVKGEYLASGEAPRY